MADTIHKFCYEVFTECGQDVTRAKERAKERIWAEPELRDALVRELAETAIESELNAMWRAGRTKTWTAAKGETTPMNPVMRAAMTERMEGLMFFQMPDGRRLADLTKNEIEAYGHQMVTAGRTQMQRGQWLLGVANLLKADEKPRDVLREADLQRVQKRVLNREGRRQGHLARAAHIQLAEPASIEMGA